MLLIVNADDFGQSPAVNAGIVEAHQRGIVTSTTLMANGPAFDDAVAQSRLVPSLGVGLHLNLVEGAPVSPVGKVRTMLRADGCFGGKWSLLRRWASGAIDPCELRHEVTAQLGRLRAAGVEPTHLDSHQHVHAWPSLFRLVVGTARELGISAVRNPGEPLTGNIWPPHPGGLARLLALRSASRWNRRWLTRQRLKTTDGFGGIVQTGRLSADWILRWLPTLRGESCELMAHPGRVDAMLRDSGSRLQASRVEELNALTDPRVRTAVAERGILLINYQGLPAWNCR